MLAISALHQQGDLFVSESHRHHLCCLFTTSGPSTLAQLLRVVASLGFSNPGVNLPLGDLLAPHLPHAQ